MIANLRRLTLQKEALVQIIEGSRRLMCKLYVTEEEIEPQSALEYRRIVAGIHLWGELGVRGMLRRRFAQQQCDLPPKERRLLVCFNRRRADVADPIIFCARIGTLD